YRELKNLCVWSKTNAGMGSLYRSQHELIFVFKNGSAQHINNVELGRFGRNRSNVWNYAGVNSFGKDRDTELAMTRRLSRQPWYPRRFSIAPRGVASFSTFLPAAAPP